MMEAHDTPAAMARALCSYIADDARVLSEVRSEFGMGVQLGPISEIRAAKERHDEWFSRGRVAAGVDSKGWDWRGDHYRTEMEIASGFLLDAIERERRA